MTIPTVETIEYARSVLANQISRYKRFENECRERARAAGPHLAESELVMANKFRAVHTALVRDLYGYEDGGCVITAFDQRWLNPEFRQMMQEVFDD